MTADRAPLYGLVLAGGASRRMRPRQGGARATTASRSCDWACELLPRHCAQVFVSIRADQTDDPVRRGLPADRRRARRHRPDRRHRRRAGRASGARLARARLRPAVPRRRRIDAPASQRATAARCIAYRSSHDGLPEPLCAIYEPRRRAGVLRGHRSRPQLPAQVPARHRRRGCCEQADPRALDNVNTPDELQRARGPARRSRPAMTDCHAAVLRRAARAGRPQRGARRDRRRARRRSCTTSCANATASRCRARCCASRSTTSSATGRAAASRRPRRVHPARRGRLNARHSRFSTSRSTRPAAARARRPGARRLRDVRRLGAQPQRGPRGARGSSTRPLPRWPIREGERIVAEAIARFGVEHAACVHRIGEPGTRRHGGLGRRQRRASRRGLRRLPLHHRRSEAPRADLEEGTLRRRRLGLGQLRALRAAPAQHAGHEHAHAHARSPSCARTCGQRA